MASTSIVGRIFQRKPDVNRDSRQEFFIFHGQWARAVHQFQHADDFAHTIDNRHAENVVRAISQSRIEAGIETGVRVSVRNIDRLACRRNSSGNAFADRNRKPLSLQTLSHK